LHEFQDQNGKKVKSFKCVSTWRLVVLHERAVQLSIAHSSQGDK